MRRNTLTLGIYYISELFNSLLIISMKTFCDNISYTSLSTLIFPMLGDVTIEDSVPQDVDTFSHSFLSSCDQDGLS